MSFGRRNQQWSTFTRVWYLLNADRQPPGKLAEISSKYLKGEHKPIFHPKSDVGDHVVIINSSKIAYSGNKWEQKTFHSYTGRPKGRLALQAYKIHEMDPTWIVRRMVYRNLSNTAFKRRNMFARLHVFPDEELPQDILDNLSFVIPPPRLVPKGIDDYTQEEIDNFPRVWQPADDFLIRWWPISTAFKISSSYFVIYTSALLLSSKVTWRQGLFLDGLRNTNSKVSLVAKIDMEDGEPKLS